MNTSTMTNTALISTLHSVTDTMLNIESGKLKLPSEKVRSIASNAHALMDEVVRRGLQADAAKTPTSLRSRLTTRGIK